MGEEKGEIKRKNKHADTEKKTGILKKVIIGSIILMVIIVISSVIWYNASLSGVGRSEEEVKIEIAIGSSTNKIADILKENGAIKSKIAFKLYVKLNKVNSFQAGSYTITKDMSVSEIVQALQTGKVLKKDNLSITFIEGKTFRYVAKEIAKNTSNTEEDVYELIENEEYIDSLINKYWFITEDVKNENIYYALEGYLFPDTYSFENENVTAKEIVEAMLDKMEKILALYKEDIEKSSYSIHEILTIASIAENEAIFDKDRKGVTSVVYNRLKSNMSIGSDVTTYYAFKVELGSRDLYKSEINEYNLYNTRGPNMQGKLPIGPICVVGKSSIEAAIYPSTTDYLFFVADASGNIYFTKTNEEHQSIVNELKSTGAWYDFSK